MNSHLQIEKKLTQNDTDTGDKKTNQAGVLIPKQAGFLGFFPPLDPKTFNPRVVMDFVDDAGKEWSFNFIYYNNKLFQKGTRNEYRLTGMTAFCREHSLKAGDTLIIRKGNRQAHEISYRRLNSDQLDSGRIKLGAGSWKLIEFSDD